MEFPRVALAAVLLAAAASQAAAQGPRRGGIPLKRLPERSVAGDDSMSIIPVTGDLLSGPFEKVLQTRVARVDFPAGGVNELMDAIVSQWSIKSLSFSGNIELPVRVTLFDVTLEEALDAVADSSDKLFWQVQKDRDGPAFSADPPRARIARMRYDVTALISPAVRDRPKRLRAAMQQVAEVVATELAVSPADVSKAASRLSLTGRMLSASLSRREHRRVHQLLVDMSDPMGSGRATWSAQRDWVDLVQAALDRPVEVFAVDQPLDDFLASLGRQISLSVTRSGGPPDTTRIALKSQGRPLRAILTELCPAESWRPYVSPSGIVLTQDPPLRTFVYGSAELERALTQAADAPPADTERLAGTKLWKEIVAAVKGSTLSRYGDAVIVRTTLEAHASLRAAVRQSR